MIVPLHKKYFEEMADIHCNSLKGDFQVLLGKSFLIRVYKRYELSEYGTGYIFLNQDKPAGFILATYDIDRFMRELLVKDGLKLLIVVFGKILRNPLIIPTLVNQFILNLNLKKVNMKAELVTIAVDYKYRNRGIGGSLLNAVINDFYTRGIPSFKLTTDGINDSSNKFYQEFGFKLVYSFKRFSARQNIYAYYSICNSIAKK